MKCKKSWLLCAGAVFLLAAGSRMQNNAEPVAEEVFDRFSEYLVLSRLENERAVGQNTVLPDYVTRYSSLYAPENGHEDTDGEVQYDGEAGEEEEAGSQEEKKTAYLTFDDGPSAETERVLDILKEEGIHATFFVIGEQITEETEALLVRMVEEGHTIGLHTYCHDYDVIYRSVDAFLEDYELLYKRIYEVTGIKPTIYRFPGGSKNKYVSSVIIKIIEEMDRRGFSYYDWNVSAEDSVGTPTAYSIRTNIFKDVFRYEKPVLLMHDSSVNHLTVTLLPELIHEIQQAGYGFDTLDHRECCQFSR